MTSIKCPECGANMDSEGSFCKYCGAKIPDDVKKMALEINDLAQMEKVKLWFHHSRHPDYLPFECHWE